MTTLLFTIYALLNQSFALFQIMLPILFVEALLTMKWAAPLIPWKQAIMASVTVLLIHFIAEHFVPVLLVAEKIIELVCVAGFGAKWLRQGFIPVEANKW